MIGELFSMAIYNISHRKLRSTLTTLGIIIGVATIIAVLALGNGMQESVFKQLNKIGGDSILVTPGNFMGRSLTTSPYLTDSDISTIEGVEGVEKTYGTIQTTAYIEYRSENISVSVNGISDPDIWAEIQGENLGLEDGRFISSSDKYSAVVGWSVAHDIYERDIELKKIITINGIDFKVVGILNKAGGVLASIDRAVYIPEETFRDIFSSVPTKSYSMVTAKVKKGYDINTVGDDIESALLKKRRETKDKESFTVMSPKFFQQIIGSVMGTITMFMTMIAAISLVVGGIGIANIMYVSVVERTREIGIMKALGAKSRVILMQFLLESGIIGIVGGIIGIVFGVILSFGLAAVTSAAFSGNQNSFVSTGISATITPDMILMGLAFGFVVGILSGLFPARRAASLEPVQALSYE